MNNAIESTDADLLGLKKWLMQTGISTSTAWRWRKAGHLKTVNIYGRVYLTRKAREDFVSRAEAGDFSQLSITPKREPNKVDGGAGAAAAAFLVSL